MQESLLVLAILGYLYAAKLMIGAHGLSSLPSVIALGGDLLIVFWIRMHES